MSVTSESWTMTYIPADIWQGTDKIVPNMTMLGYYRDKLLLRKHIDDLVKNNGHAYSPKCFLVQGKSKNISE